MSVPARIPIVVAVDVEPDARLIYPRDRDSDWVGVARTFELIEPLRSALGEATGAAAHFAWHLRMDEQIARAHGSPRWGALRFRAGLDALERQGDEIGLHPHLWRWHEARQDWIADFGDAAWTARCLTDTFAAFAQHFGRVCRSVRIGDRWTSTATMALLERLGARFDLSVEPGRAPEDLEEPFTGAQPDYSHAPRLPYRPSRRDFLRPGRWRPRRLWVLPMSTARLDSAARAIAVKSHAVATRAARATAMARSGSARAPAFEGWHERADGEAISGWAYDAAHPDDTVAVEIRAGEALLATLDADTFRPDLCDAGKGDGRHGFVFPVPDALRDGSAHVVRVLIAGSDLELSGTPKEIRCWQHERRRCDYEQLNPALPPSLFAGMVEAVLTEESAPYLALAISSASLRHADQQANFESNLTYLATHPWARRFLLTTPAEAIDLLR